MTAPITVRLEDRPHEMAAGSTLQDLVQTLGHAPQGVTTAVNGEFVARPRRADTVLRDGDRVLLYQPIVGG